MDEGKPKYRIFLPKKVRKQLEALPEKIQDRFDRLQQDLVETGPMQPGWPNFSKLGLDKYHCHLTYFWVACWTYDKGNILIEVYYVGSRKNAPY